MYLSDGGMDSDQIAEIGLSGAEFQADGEALHDLARVRRQNVHADDFLLRNPASSSVKITHTETSQTQYTTGKDQLVITLVTATKEGN